MFLVVFVSLSAGLYKCDAHMNLFKPQALPPLHEWRPPCLLKLVHSGLQSPTPVKMCPLATPCQTSSNLFTM